MTQRGIRIIRQHSGVHPPISAQPPKPSPVLAKIISASRDQYPELFTSCHTFTNYGSRFPKANNLKINPSDFKILLNNLSRLNKKHGIVKDMSEFSYSICLVPDGPGQKALHLVIYDSDFIRSELLQNDKNIMGKIYYPLRGRIYIRPVPGETNNHVEAANEVWCQIIVHLWQQLVAEGGKVIL